MTVSESYYFPGRPVDDARPAPSHIDVMFVGTSAEDYTVPANCRVLVMRGNKDFYANPNDDAAIPTDDVADGTGSALNPVTWLVSAGQTVSFIGSDASTIITIECYSE